MHHTVWGSLKDGYIISINGDIRSLNRTQLIYRKGSLVNKPYKRSIKGKLVEPRITHKGYKRIQLGKRVKEDYVHRIVLKTFIGIAPTDKHQCDHIDHNKINNKVENLEWVTQSENIQRSIKHGSRLKVNRLKGRCW